MSARREPRLPATALAAVLAVAAGACATQTPRTVDFSETPRNYVGKDYEEIYRLWTRHERAFSDVDVALEAWATYKSWDFREAYIARYAAAYELSEADRETLRQSQLEAFRHAYEFHVVAQSASFNWNDLEKRNSAWRTTLVDALGHEIAPEAIKVEKLPPTYEKEFFPYKTPFSKSYTIRFLVPAGGDNDFAGPKTGSITLRIASPVGRVDLTWRVGPAPRPVQPPAPLPFDLGSASGARPRSPG